MAGRFYILMLVALAGFSCKKEMKKTVIDGVVKDFITGQPLEGTEVYLQRSHQDEHSHAVVETVMSAITGSDGKFYFEFHALKAYDYGLEYQKPSQCYYDNLPPIPIETGKKNTPEIKLQSFLNLYIHIKNVSPFDSNDHICYVFSKTETTCHTPGFYGTAVDLTKTLTTDVNQLIYIKSFITKNSITTTRLDSVNIVPCTNQTLDIFY